MKSRFFFISLILFTFLNSFAQQTFQLSDCLEFTLQNSPKIKAEKLNQEKETATILQQKSSFLPQVDGFLHYHNYFNDLPTYIFPQPEGSNLAGVAMTAPYYPVQLGLPHNLNTGLEINQTIFDMRFFGNNDFQQHFQSYKAIKLSIAEEEILYQAAVLFYQTAVNEERLDFLQMNLDRLNKLQSIVQLQVEQGFARQTDLDRLVVKTTNLTSKKSKLKSGIQQQLRYLKLMMGMDASAQLVLKYDKLQPLNADSDNVIEEEPLAEKLLEEQLELNKKNAKRINADYYPKLQAYAAFLFQAQRDRFNFTETGQDWYNIHQWGIKLSVPIMRGLERKSKKEISEIVNNQLNFGMEQKRAQSQAEYQNAVAELEVARIEQNAQSENVALAERMYRQSELSFEKGTMLLMDLMDSEATLREAKMMYTTALLDTRIAELKILKASGKLKELIN